MGFGSLDNQLHIANKSGEDLYVVVTPNKKVLPSQSPWQQVKEPPLSAE
ncbi:hypothetical protein [Brevibacillus sp. NRS-1366]